MQHPTGTAIFQEQATLEVALIGDFEYVTKFYLIIHFVKI